jgi:hypothetical protein
VLLNTRKRTLVPTPLTFVQWNDVAAPVPVPLSATPAPGRLSEHAGESNGGESNGGEIFLHGQSCLLEDATIPRRSRKRKPRCD